jgi:hypothetical protein
MRQTLAPELVAERQAGADHHDSPHHHVDRVAQAQRPLHRRFDKSSAMALLSS